MFGVEASYPASEGTSEGILQMLGNAGSIVILVFIQLVQNNQQCGMILMVALLLLSAVPMFIVKEGSAKERFLEI